MTETNRIEYKRELTDSLEKEVVAFLNYSEGGVIYIGKDDDGSNVGVDNPDDTQLRIKDRLKNNILPSCMGLFDIETLNDDGVSVLKITLASGPEKPYHLKKYGMTPKGVFLRVGTAAEPMTIKMIDELYSKRARNSIGNIKSPRQDLSFTQLKIYYEGAGKELNDNFATNLELINEDNAFNYVAYLMANQNNASIKVAKYSSLDRVELIENNEYGYECIIKATEQVLAKIGLENKTSTEITSTTRKETRLWNEIALREAIINAFVHNDYTREVMPKFEIFPDRIEITSAGGLPQGLTEEEFFSGFSVPRNQELMRIYKDLEFVEQLGSGVQRILRAYNRDSFTFSPNFLRITYHSTEQAPNKHRTSTEQVTEQVKKLMDKMVLGETYTREGLMEMLGMKHRPTFIYNYIQPALELGVIEMTIPDKPNSSNQKYRLTK